MIRFGSRFGRVAGGPAVLGAGLAVACGLGLGLRERAGLARRSRLRSQPRRCPNCQQASVGADVI
jgi:hypothetical protein